MSRHAITSRVAAVTASCIVGATVMFQNTRSACYGNSNIAFSFTTGDANVRVIGLSCVAVIK